MPWLDPLGSFASSNSYYLSCEESVVQSFEFSCTDSLARSVDEVSKSNEWMEMRLLFPEYEVELITDKEGWRESKNERLLLLLSVLPIKSCNPFSISLIWWHSRLVHQLFSPLTVESQTFVSSTSFQSDLSRCLLVWVDCLCRSRSILSMIDVYFYTVILTRNLKTFSCYKCPSKTTTLWL